MPAMTVQRSCCAALDPPLRLAILKQLRELKLYDNAITSISGLQSLTLLHTLELGGNRISQMQVGLHTTRPASTLVGQLLEMLSRLCALEKQQTSLPTRSAHAMAQSTRYSSMCSLIPHVWLSVPKRPGSQQQQWAGC